MLNLQKPLKYVTLLLCSYLSLPLSALPVNGLELEVVQSGSGDVVLLFESGFGLGPQVWQQVVDGLPNGVLAVRYARAGTGKSEDRANTSSISEHLADLTVLADTFSKNKKLILIGHSYGGLLATEYARRYADRLSGLLLIDPSVLQQRRWFKAVAAQAVMEEDKLLSRILPLRMLVQFEKLNRELDEVSTEIIPLPSDLNAVLLTSTRIEPNPIAFIETEAGKVQWLKLHEALFSGVKNGSHHRVDQLGHNMLQEDPALVLHALKTLL